MPEATGVLSILRCPRQYADVETGTPTRRASVATLAEPTESKEQDSLEGMQQALETLPATHPQDYPRHLSSLQGSKVVRQRKAKPLVSQWRAYGFEESACTEAVRVSLWLPKNRMR